MPCDDHTLREPGGCFKAATVEPGEKVVALDIEEALEARPYRQCTAGLEVDGIPWMPIVGRNSFVRTASPSPWHTHRGCIEIVYCQHGMCEYESRGQIYRLTPGRVFVSRPTESHRMLSNPKGLATCYLLFRLPGRGTNGPFAPEVAFWAKRLKQLPRLFDAGSRTGSWFVRLFRILDTRFADLAERRIRLHHVCTGLLLSVIDASTTQFATGKSDRIAALASEMRTHPERGYPIEELSARIGFSASSLLQGFKTTTGYTPHAYLLKCRVDYAKALLARGDRSITQIASMLGFPSPQHFATQFRNATGMSPRAWIAKGGPTKAPSL